MTTIILSSWSSTPKRDPDGSLLEIQLVSRGRRSHGRGRPLIESLPVRTKKALPQEERLAKGRLARDGVDSEFSSGRRVEKCLRANMRGCGVTKHVGSKSMIFYTIHQCSDLSKPSIYRQGIRQVMEDSESQQSRFIRRRLDEADKTKWTGLGKKPSHEKKMEAIIKGM